MIAVFLVLAVLTPDENFFDKKVAPILQKRCLGCHNEELKDGGLSFIDRATLLSGRTRGPVVAPGKPDESLLLRAVRHDGDLKMPPGLPLPTREIKILREWVQRGVPWGRKLRKP